MSHPATSPLPPAQERLAIGALALAAFVVAVNVNLVGALMPYLADAPTYASLPDDDSVTQRGQLLWTTSLAAALASLFLGPVVDRVGRRGPMIVGTVLFLLGMAGHLWAESHGFLLAMRVLSGLGGGLVFTSASAAVADLVPYQRRGAAMGLFSLGLFLATPLGLPLGIWFAEMGAESWRWAFAWLAVPAVLSIGGFLRFLPKDIGVSDQRVSQLEVLRQPHVPGALLSVLLYTGGFFTAIQFAPSWLDETGLLPKSEQPFLWIVLGFSTAAGSLFLPRLADRFGKRNVVLLTSVGVAVLLVLLGWVRSVPQLWLVGIPLTLLAAARTPSLQALMSEIVEPRMRGTLMGLRAAAVNAGAFLFAAVGSGLYADHGYQGLLRVMAVAIALSYFLVRYFVRVRL